MKMGTMRAAQKIWGFSKLIVKNMNMRNRNDKY